jgi:hypothetical protein
MTVKRTFLLSVVPLISILATTARADDDDAPPPPPPPQSPLPVYTAPLSQQTQTTYVPQSVALSGPEEITDVDEGRATPLGYTEVHRTRKGLLIGGGVTFGVSYGISLLSAAIGEDTKGGGKNDAAAMAIPVAGPFLEMGQTDSATLRLFLAGLGAAQVAGAVMLYYGLTTTKKVFVRNDLVGSMTITPMAGNGTSGMALVGHF